MRRLEFTASAQADTGRAHRSVGWRPPDNQFIAVAVAEKVGGLETADEFLRRRAGKAKPRDLLTFTRKAGREASADADRR